MQGARLLVEASRVKFTKHALEKFKTLRKYGFEIAKEQVIDAVVCPERVDKRGDQFLQPKS